MLHLLLLKIGPFLLAVCISWMRGLVYCSGVFPKVKMSLCMALTLGSLYNPIHAHLEYILAHFELKWHAKEFVSPFLGIEWG